MTYYLGEYTMHYEYSCVHFVATSLDQAKSLMLEVYPKAALVKEETDGSLHYKIDRTEDFAITPIQLGVLL